MWDRWPYSEVLEYYFVHQDDLETESDELNDIDYKSFDHQIAMTLRRICAKM